MKTHMKYCEKKWSSVSVFQEMEPCHQNITISFVSLDKDTEKIPYCSPCILLIFLNNRKSIYLYKWCILYKYFFKIKHRTWRSEYCNIKLLFSHKSMTPKTLYTTLLYPLELYSYIYLSHKIRIMLKHWFLVSPNYVRSQ